jgi:polyhydroxybutyrate depolymerase
MKGRRSAGCGGATPAASGQMVAGTVNASARTRTFHVTTPEVYDTTKAYALVLVLHGAGDTSPETMNEWFVAPDYPSAIYVYPQALPRTRKDGSGGNIPRWDLDGSEDLAFYDSLVDRLEGAYCVDTARVFAAGFSSGGNFAQQLGCLRSASLRGFAAVAGPGPFTTKCGGAIAAWMTHDVDDKALSVEGARDSRDFWAGHDACGAKWSPSAKLPPACTTNTGCAAATPLVYCETKGIGHEVPPFASKAIGEFFASLD